MSTGYLYTPCYNAKEKFFEACSNYEPWGDKCKNCSRNNANLATTKITRDHYREAKETTDVYRHKKSGNLYRVLGPAVNATNACNLQPMVSYVRINDDRDSEYYGVMWVREKDEFDRRFEPWSNEFPKCGRRYLVVRSEGERCLDPKCDYQKRGR